MRSDIAGARVGDGGTAECMPQGGRVAGAGVLEVRQRQGLGPFLEAQQAYDYSRVVQELRGGRKTGHWIWFIFPQLVGLGHSSRSTYFGIVGLGEAAEYLGHPILGPRLRECTGSMLSIQGRSAAEVLGETDAMKFRSSMTLFAEVEGGEGPFEASLAKYFAGEPDRLTLARLGPPASDGHE